MRADKLTNSASTGIFTHNHLEGFTENGLKNCSWITGLCPLPFSAALKGKVCHGQGSTDRLESLLPGSCSVVVLKLDNLSCFIRWSTNDPTSFWQWKMCFWFCSCLPLVRLCSAVQCSTMQGPLTENYTSNVGGWRFGLLPTFLWRVLPFHTNKSVGLWKECFWLDKYTDTIH